MKRNRVFVDANEVIRNAEKFELVLKACSPTKAYIFVHNEGAFYENRQSMRLYNVFADKAKEAGTLLLPGEIALHEDYPALIFDAREIMRGRPTSEEVVKECRKKAAGCVVINYDEAARRIEKSASRPILELISLCSKKGVDLEITENPWDTVYSHCVENGEQ